jgi:D-amino peptidase
LISGDEVTVQEVQNIAPDAEKVVVKNSLGRFAAAHVHPSIACELLHRGASHAVSNLKKMHPPVFNRPISLEVTFLVADMAEMALWVRGVERVGPRTIVLSNKNMLDLYQIFVTVVTLTRALVDR